MDHATIALLIFFAGRLIFRGPDAASGWLAFLRDFREYRAGR